MAKTQRLTTSMCLVLMVILCGVDSTRADKALSSKVLDHQIAKLTASDVEDYDQFGGSISLSGDIALIGASGDDDGGSSSGAAYIFERNQGGTDEWGQVTKLTAGDAQSDIRFGIEVSLSGATALVSAHTGTGLHAGAAYIFERDSGGSDNWGQTAKLIPSENSALDWFGASVSLSGTTALVGAGQNNSRGAAYVFERDQGGVGNWGQVAKLTAGDGMPGDKFGMSLFLSGTTAFIGAYEHDEHGVDSGAVYVFERDQGGSGNWGQVTKLTAADAAAYDYFGASISLSGTTALIGASLDEADSGSAYVFERDQGGPEAWGQTAKLRAEDADVVDYFGSSVSLDGTRALIGAHGDDDFGASSGSAYVFETDIDGNWQQVRKLNSDDASAGDRFGSVLLNGDTALVGAGGDNTFSGAVYVFSTDLIDGPNLEVPDEMLAAAGQYVEAPIQFTANGAEVAATAFSVDYDADCLGFDPTDADLDGIPDAITFHMAGDFTPTVFFNLGDADGEIDIAIADVTPPFAALVDGDLATVTFTTDCEPDGSEMILAPVGFSFDPAASFSDGLAQNIPGTTKDGSVKIVSGLRGDCNHDGIVDAADLIACVLEAFDGDGNSWVDVAGGTYSGDPVGCDANADLMVDSGDLTCKVRLIFGLSCDDDLLRSLPEADASSPWLSLPHSLTIEDGKVVLEVRLDAADHELSATFFAIDYDETLLSFDPTDADQDGIPDSVRFLGTSVSHQSVIFDPARADAELSFLIADLIQNPNLLADGALVRLELELIHEEPGLERALRFANDPAPSFGDIWGRSIPGGGGIGSRPFFADDFESGNLSAWSR